MRIDTSLARQVEALAAYGIAVEDIALILKMDEQDLRQTCSHELATGAARANSRVAENLYRRATGESREAVPAAIFWLKARAGWRETTGHAIEGSIRYVARLPEPVATHDEWLDRYALPNPGTAR